jgi:hypothetical protein
MSRIWVENGIVKCCSDVCGSIVSGGDTECHRIDRCEYIDSPIKLLKDKQRLIDVLKMCVESQLYGRMFARNLLQELEEQP